MKGRDNMRRVDYAHVRRLVCSVLLRGFCLLASLAVLGVGARAAPLQDPGTGLEPETHVSGWPNDAASGVVTYTVDYTIYLPIVRRNYRQFANGGFEDGWSGWDTQPGPFSGHGSGLPQSVVIFGGGNRALLGEPSASNDSIPVGYGTIAQTFTLEKRYVRLQYWIFSYDIARGSQRYFDTFEVSVNRPPDQISTAERHSRGCANSMLNPEGTVTVSEDGLVFCGGQPGSSGQGTLWNTQGWKTVTLDLSAFRGTNVTLYFTIWSREYESPFYKDQGWFNTWAYVDNVQLTNGV
jgi:hypothetical protein